MVNGAAGCGPTICFVIFVQEVVLLLALAVQSFASSRAPAARAERERSSESGPVSHGPKAGEELGDDTRFLYDVVAREQERVVQIAMRSTTH